MKQAKYNYHGFSLLETVIAIGIVVVGATAVLGLLNQSLKGARLSEDAILTTNLAREGVELVHSIRDSSSGGFAALPDGNWIIDSRDYYGITNAADNSIIADCINCRLYITNDQYSHTSTGGVSTPFKRNVTITDLSPGHVTCAGAGICEKMITVSIARDGNENVFSLVTYLTDWR